MCRATASLGRLLAVLLLVGCSALPRFERPRPEPRTARRTPIAKALDYILKTQWTKARSIRADHPWAGHWPQSMAIDGLPGRIVDVNSGSPAFIYHALCHVNERTVLGLGLTLDDAADARAARKRTARFFRRFEERAGFWQAGFGWWPRADVRKTPLRRLVGQWIAASAGGPSLYGPLAPPSMPSHPPILGIFPDADSSAYVHMALLRNQELDGGRGPPPGLGALITRWRDDKPGVRGFPLWLPKGSGAFLTHLTRRPMRINDVDLVVLANCVWALAALEQTDTPGYAESVRVLDEAIRSGRHRCHEQATRYYTSPFALHCLVARAHIEGPIPELAEAVDILADDVEARACGGRWPGRTPASNAACAIGTLAYAGRSGPLLDAACRELVRLQDPRSGAWPDELITAAETDRGQLVEWRCRAAVTGAAMAALIGAKLGRAIVR